MTNNEYKRLRKGMWIICEDKDRVGLAENKAYQIAAACQATDEVIVITINDSDEAMWLSEKDVISCFERNYKFLSSGHVLQLLRSL